MSDTSDSEKERADFERREEERRASWKLFPKSRDVQCSIFRTLWLDNPVLKHEMYSEGITFREFVVFVRDQ